MQPVFPIFVSSGRTGLTLLRVMFHSHPELAVMHEPRFLAPMARNRRRYERRDGVDLERFVHDLYGFVNFRRLGLPLEEVRPVLRDDRAATFADAVRRVYRLYADREGKRWYGDKTPLYISHIELLGGLFPEARFVHVIRDGRDVTLAYLEREAGPSSVAEGAFHWRLRVSRGRRAGERLGPERYREFRYESLVEDPQETVRDICRFIGLPFDRRMLDYQETVQRFLADAKHPEDHRHLTLAPTRGLTDWRTRMSQEELALFEAIAGDLLEELGYEAGADRRVSPALVGSEWLRWQAGRVAWRFRWHLLGDRTRLRASSLDA